MKNGQVAIPKGNFFSIHHKTSGATIDWSYKKSTRKNACSNKLAEYLDETFYFSGLWPPCKELFATSSFPLGRVLPGLFYYFKSSTHQSQQFQQFQTCQSVHLGCSPPQFKTQPKSCSLSLSREAWSLLVDRFKASSSVLESGSLCTISPQNQGIYH